MQCFVIIHYFMAPITSSKKGAENALYLPIFKEFDQNRKQFFDCVECTRNRFTAVESTLFTAFANICFKEPNVFPELIILERYNYSPRYIS